MSTMNMNSSTSSLNSLSGSRIGRQFRNLQSKSATTHRLVSAWNGLRELVGYSYRGNITPVNSGLPVHTAWSQYDLSLAVGGDARYKYTAIFLLRGKISTNILIFCTPYVIVYFYLQIHKTVGCT